VKTALIPALALLALLVACGGPEPWQQEDPREAARYFLSAAHNQNGEAMWRMLDPSTQKLLEERAAAINQKASGEAVLPSELMTSVGFAAPYKIKKIELTEPSDVAQALQSGRAKLSIQTQLEQTWSLQMKRVGQTWRVVMNP
jgi:hypothetical protein